MSHFTKIATEITDLNVLNKAVKNMGFSMERDAYCRYYYGSKIKDYVIKLPGEYDAGLINSNGIYNIDADFYNGHVEKFIGKNGSQLLKQYAIEKIKADAKKKGYRVKENGAQLKVTNLNSGGNFFITFDENNKVIIDAKGFVGQSCMDFAEIEKALGRIEEFEEKPEFYNNVITEKEILNEWS